MTGLFHRAALALKLAAPPSPTAEPGPLAHLVRGAPYARRNRIDRAFLENFGAVEGATQPASNHVRWFE